MKETRIARTRIARGNTKAIPIPSIKPLESTTNIINKIGKTIKVDTKLI